MKILQQEMDLQIYLTGFRMEDYKIKKLTQF